LSVCQGSIIRTPAKALACAYDPAQGYRPIFQLAACLQENEGPAKTTRQRRARNRVQERSDHRTSLPFFGRNLLYISLLQKV
jgi:hypothetical protein